MDRCIQVYWYFFNQTYITGNQLSKSVYWFPVLFYKNFTFN
jgi:hypothetical protein